MLPRAALRDEIASDLYCGGALIPDLGSIHPGLYHRGLTERARAAGAVLLAAPGSSVSRRSMAAASTWRRRSAPRVPATCWSPPTAIPARCCPGWQRRLIPFDAYMIATEPLAPALMNRLLPTDRTYIDHVHDIISMRRLARRQPHPLPVAHRHEADRRARQGGAALARRRAHRARDRDAQDQPFLDRPLRRHLRSLAAYRATRRHLFRRRLLLRRRADGDLSRRQGRASYSRQQGGRYGLRERGFPTVPFYSGKPWFVPAVMKYYGLRDRWASR